MSLESAVLFGILKIERSQSDRVELISKIMDEMERARRDQANELQMWGALIGECDQLGELHRLLHG